MSDKEKIKDELELLSKIDAEPVGCIYCGRKDRLKYSEVKGFIRCLECQKEFQPKDFKILYAIQKTAEECKSIIEEWGKKELGEHITMGKIEWLKVRIDNKFGVGEK